MFVILATVMLLLLGPASAYAEVPASDDGQDYGWLYRKGDYLYKEGDIRVCELRDGDWYKANVQPSTNDWNVVYTYYADGTLYMHPYTSRVLVDAVIRSGAFPSHSSMTDPNWGRLQAEYALPRFECYDDASRKVDVARIKRVVFDEDVAELWGYHPYNSPSPYYSGTYDLSSIFDGYRCMIELRGLQYMPTERISSMNRMFADCAQLEEFDLSAFDTSECTSFDKMFDGCVSMTSLTLGDGWTQAIPLAKREERIEALRSEAEAKRAEEEARKAEEGANDADEGLDITDAVDDDEGAVSDESLGDDAGTPSEGGQSDDVTLSDQGDEENPLGDDGSDATSSLGLQDQEHDSDADDPLVDAAGAASMGAMYSDSGVVRSGAYDPSSNAGAMRQAGEMTDDESGSDVDPESSQPAEGEATEGDANGSDVDASLQEAIDEVLSDTTDLATFPVDMYGTRGGETMLYHAGEVIPEGAGTYEVANRTHIKNADVYLGGGADPVCASAGGRLACEYTGEPVEPAVSVRCDGRELEEGSDYSVAYSDNVETGTGSVTITGKGACYGSTTVTFEIADTGAYAFLYADGRLYLKASHELPDKSVISRTSELIATMRWFDSSDEAPGSAVPWSRYAAKVKSVTFDPSFKEFKPTSAKGWFSGCTGLTKVSGWENVDASSLASMEAMFKGCTSLADLDLSGLSAAGVTDLSDFVSGCSKLETLNLGSIDAYNATNMKGFLYGCSKLKRLMTAKGWRNAKAASARLAMPVDTVQTGPVYKRYSKGSAIPNNAGSGTSTYQLRDLALSFAKVKMPSSTYTCTGKAIKPKLTVTLGGLTLREGTDYTVSYANNVQTGNAKATIKGKGVFSGGLVVPFRIKARTIKVGDRLTYTDGRATYTFVVTKPDNKGARADAEIEVVDVRGGGLEVLALPTQCTIGGVKVSLTSVSSKLRGNFRNVRTVVIGPYVTTIGAYAFRRTPKVRTVVLKTARIKHMGKCLKGSNVTLVQAKVSLSRTKQKNYRYWFTHYSYCGKSGVRFRYW